MRSFALLLVLALAACGPDVPATGADAPASPPSDSPQTPETPVPPSSEGPASADRAQAAALDAALDTLETLVAVLEEIQSPINAWNRAPEVARLMRSLEAAEPALTLDMPEEEARRRFGPQIARFEALQDRRLAELERIEADPVAAQVLYEEIVKADTTG